MSTLNTVVSSITREVQDLVISWRLKGASLLNIEDDPEIVSLVRNKLIDFEVLTFPAKNEDEAVKVAQAVRPKIIIVDWKLSDDSDGFKAVARIQKELGIRVPTIVHSGYLVDARDCENEAQKSGAEFDYFVRKVGNHINEIAKAVFYSVGGNGQLRKQIEEIVFREIRVLVPETKEMETKAIHQGKVESLTDVESVISFETEEGTFRVSFPTWRLIRAKADDIGVEVEHRIMATGTQMISDLRAVSPVTYEEEELEELPEETLERIRKWEEEQRNERK